MQKNLPIIFIKNLSEENENHLNIVEQNNISCGYVHEKFIILGCNNGQVFVFDHLGYLFFKYTKLKTTIKKVSIDDSGDYILVYSQSLNIIVVGMISNDQYTFELENEISAASMPLDFSRRTVKCVIACCNKRVLLIEKKMFGNSKTLIYTNEENCHVIKWHKNLVAWANFISAHIFDLESHQLIGYVSFKEKYINSKNVFIDIIWENGGSILYIAIENSVHIFKIQKNVFNKDRSQTTLFNVHQINEIKLSHNLFGCCLSMNNLICIGKKVTTSTEDEYFNVDTSFTIYHLKNKDEIKNIGHQVNSVRVKSLSSPLITFSLNTEPCFYLCVENSLYSLRLRDNEDLIKCLIEDSKYEEAYFKIAYISDQKLINKTTSLYLSQCLMNEKYEMAESIVKNIKKNDIFSWKEIVDVYIQYSKIEFIIDFIPILGNGTMSKIHQCFYGRILASLLDKKRDLFCACITKWPKSCYDSCEIIKLINSSNIDSSEREILSAKALLHSQNNDFIEALNIFISLKEPKAFELIVQHKLFSRLKLYLIDLIEINSHETIKICIDHREEILVEDVCRILISKEEILLTYLSGLHFENSKIAKDYIDLHLELCIKYTSEKAFAIIRDSSDYNVPKALQLCKKYDLFNEYAFLCERSGDLQTALETYLFKLNDIQKAVELCNRIQDPNFWDLLISFCVVDPKNICVLLTNTSHQLDLCKLIQKIPNDVCLDKLRETIAKIFYDVHTRISLMESCKIILEFDNVKNLVRAYKMLKRGSSINATKKCSICHETIIVEQSFYVQDVVIFLCDHAYHSDCLSKKIGRDDVCIYCNSDHFIKPEKLYKIRLS